MERLLMLRLRSLGCAAEARVNDIPVARTPPEGGMLSLPVHEYVFEGANEISLVVGPVAEGGSAAPRLVDGVVGASLRMLLPRVGQVGSESTARTLAEIDWAAADGDVFAPPVEVQRSVMLPVKFPRWRFVDLPPVVDVSAAQPLIARFVQSLAISLAKGDAEPFAQAARLRFDELGLAYQQQSADLVARWRSRIQLLHATKALKPVLPSLNDVLLRPCAGSRLIECVAPTGEGVLRTEPGPDGASHVWPIRVAIVDGRCHIVR